MFTQEDIEISRHAFIQASRRGITPDLIEKTLLTGKHVKFGKNYIKFVGKRIICVGEIKCMKVKILTIMLK